MNQSHNRKLPKDAQALADAAFNKTPVSLRMLSDGLRTTGLSRKEAIYAANSVKHYVMNKDADNK